MDLVEIDRVDSEPLETAVRLPQDRVTLKAVHDPATRSLQERSLGKHIGTLREAGQGTPNDRFGVAEAVGGGRVDPVDALFEGVVNRGDRLLILLGPPAELPASAADRPGTE